MARKSKAKSDSEMVLPPEGRIEQLLAAFTGRTNDDIFDFMVGEPEFIRCISDDKKRAERAKIVNIDVPEFDKIGRQRLQEQIRSVRHKWDNRMKERAAIDEAAGEKKPIFFHDIIHENIRRIQIDNAEVDNIFGDGLSPGIYGPVLGKTYFLAGGEGVGKTRFCIDCVGKLTDPSREDISELMKEYKSEASVIYFQNEVHASIFRQWGHGRIKEGSKLVVSDQRKLADHLALIQKVRPLCVIVDSLHMIAECDYGAGIGRTLSVYKAHASEFGYTLILICHLNKAGDVAGRRVLCHEVDGVIKAEGGLVPMQFTISCPKKNRYGRTGVSILCQHTQDGVMIINADRRRNTPGAVFGGPKPLVILGQNSQAKVLPKPNTLDPQSVFKPVSEFDKENGTKEGKKKAKNYTASADVVGG